MIIELTSDDFISSLDDGISDLWFKTKVQVCLCSALLEQTEGLDHGKGHAFTFTSNLEVHEGALSLCTPVAIRGYLQGAKRIALLSERGKEAGMLGTHQHGSTDEIGSTKAAQSLHLLLISSFYCTLF